MNEHSLHENFASLDTDQSGFITIDELLSQMPEGSFGKARQILNMMDVNQDGRVSYREFLQFYGEPVAEQDEALAHIDDGINYIDAVDQQGHYEMNTEDDPEG